jgi:hypothetical protein
MVANSVSDAVLDLLPAGAQRQELRYRFSGHQTFPFRYTWLPKSAQGLEADAGLFFRNDSIIRLGVGKNMVASMRFWCESLGIAEFDARTSCGGLTELGRALFSRDGWDPYLEDPGTLWLLHWKLMETVEGASTWFLGFTRWYKDTFTRNELVGWLAQIVDQLPRAKASAGTLKRDVDTFLRCYIPSSGDARRAVEDSFDCPLVELGLIKGVEGGLYQFVRGPKPTLPVEVFAYALSRFWQLDSAAQETLSFERILYGPGSPGAAFKLSEVALVSLLEGLPSWTGLRYDETAGLRVVLRTVKDARHTPLSILARYYNRMQEGCR